MRTEDHSSRLQWDRRLGLAPGSVERIVHSIDSWQQVQRGEIALEVYWQRVGEELGIASGDLAQLRQDFYRGDRLDSALIALIEELRTERVLVGLLSNFSRDLTKILDGLNISPLFDAVVISAQIGAMKPDARAYRAILDALEVPPALSVFVDDFEENVDGARRIGMHAIHFTPGLELKSRLMQWLER